MGPFTAGQVVLLALPYSDLSRSKLRPAVLVASAGRADWVACQITSNPYADPGAVMLQDKDFVSGSLQRVSFARPLKLVTVNESNFYSVAGVLRRSILETIRSLIVASIRSG